MFYCIGLITGLIIGCFLCIVVSKIKERINVRLFGYHFTIRKDIQISEPKEKRYKTMYFEES